MRRRDDVFYDFEKCRFRSDEAPGRSVFHRDSSSEVSSLFVLRALSDMRNGAYPILDLVPEGRDEANPRFTMSSIRHQRPLRGLKC